MITYSLAKLGRAKGLKGRKTLPGIEPSPSVEASYLRALRIGLKALTSEINAQVFPEVRAYREQQAPSLVLDADFDFTQLEQIATMLANMATRKIEAILGLEAKRTDATFMKQAKRILGIDLSSVIASEDLADTLRVIAHRNAGLIKGLFTETVGRVRSVVTTSVLNGVPVSELKGKIKSLLKISDSRARLIARDQTSKLNSSITRLRHEQAGLGEYIWRTVKDERVRERHARLEGRQFHYGEPTPAEEGLPPGQPIQCRCFAEAIIDFTFGVTAPSSNARAKAMA